MKQCPQCTLFSDDDTACCDCGYSFETGVLDTEKWDEDTAQLVEAAKQVKNSASWFYGIAGLSAVNSIFAVLGADFVFFLGLKITILTRGFFAGFLGIPVPNLGFEPALLPVAFVEILVALSFVAVGRIASRGFGFAFVVGGLVYLLDAGICLLFQDWSMLGAHAVVLLFLTKGYLATSALRKASSENAAPRVTWPSILQAAAPAVVFAPLLLVTVLVLALSSQQWNLVESQILARAPESFTVEDRSRLHHAYTAVAARFEQDGAIPNQEAARMNEAMARIIDLSGGELASREQLLELVQILESIGGIERSEAPVGGRS